MDSDYRTSTQKYIASTFSGQLSKFYTQYLWSSLGRFSRTPAIAFFLLVFRSTAWQFIVFDDYVLSKIDRIDNHFSFLRRIQSSLQQSVNSNSDDSSSTFISASPTTFLLIMFGLNIIIILSLCAIYCLLNRANCFGIKGMISKQQKEYKKDEHLKQQHQLYHNEIEMKISDFFIECLSQFLSFFVKIYTYILFVPSLYASASSSSLFSVISISNTTLTFAIGLLAKDVDYTCALTSTDQLRLRFSSDSYALILLEGILVIAQTTCRSSTARIFLNSTLVLAWFIHNISSRLFYEKLALHIESTLCIFTFFTNTALLCIVKKENSINLMKGNFLGVFLLIIIPLCLKISHLLQSASHEKNIASFTNILNKLSYINSTDPLTNINNSHLSIEESKNLDKSIDYYMREVIVIHPSQKNEISFNQLFQRVCVYHNILPNISSDPMRQSDKSSDFQKEQANLKQQIQSDHPQQQRYGQTFSHSVNTDESLFKNQFLLNNKSIEESFHELLKQIRNSRTHTLLQSKKSQSKFQNNKLSQIDQIYLVFLLEISQNMLLFELTANECEGSQSKLNLKSKQIMASLRSKATEKVRIEKYTHSTESLFSSPFASVIYFDAMIDEAKHRFNIAIEQKLEILILMKQKYLDLEQLHQMASRFLRFRIHLLAFIKSLLQIHPFNSESIRIYRSYLATLAFSDRDIYSKWFGFTALKNDSSSSEKQLLQFLNNSHELLPVRHFDSEKTCVLFSTLEFEPVIKKISHNFKPVLGLQEKIEVVNQPLTVLMPKPYEKFHAINLKSFFFRGESTSQLQTKLLFAQIQRIDGSYIVPISANVKVINSQSEFCLAASIQVINSDREYILFDSNSSQVHSMTAKCKKVFFQSICQLDRIRLHSLFPFVSIGNASKQKFLKSLQTMKTMREVKKGNNKKTLTLRQSTLKNQETNTFPGTQDDSSQVNLKQSLKTNSATHHKSINVKSINKNKIMVTQRPTETITSTTGIILDSELLSSEQQTLGQQQILLQSMPANVTTFENTTQSLSDENKINPQNFEQIKSINDRKVVQNHSYSNDEIKISNFLVIISPPTRIQMKTSNLTHHRQRTPPQSEEGIKVSKEENASPSQGLLKQSLVIENYSFYLLDLKVESPTSKGMQHVRFIELSKIKRVNPLRHAQEILSILQPDGTSASGSTTSHQQRNNTPNLPQSNFKELKLNVQNDLIHELLLIERYKDSNTPSSQNSLNYNLNEAKYNELEFKEEHNRGNNTNKRKPNDDNGLKHILVPVNKQQEFPSPIHSSPRKRSFMISFNQKNGNVGDITNNVILPKASKFRFSEGIIEQNQLNSLVFPQSPVQSPTIIRSIRSMETMLTSQSQIFNKPILKPSNKLQTDAIFNQINNEGGQYNTAQKPNQLMESEPQNILNQKLTAVRKSSSKQGVPSEMTSNFQSNYQMTITSRSRESDRDLLERMTSGSSQFYRKNILATINQAERAAAAADNGGGRRECDEIIENNQHQQYFRRVYDKQNLQMGQQQPQQSQLDQDGQSRSLFTSMNGESNSNKEKSVSFNRRAIRERILSKKRLNIMRVVNIFGLLSLIVILIVVLWQFFNLRVQFNQFQSDLAIVGWPTWYTSSFSIITKNFNLQKLIKDGSFILKSNPEVTSKAILADSQVEVISSLENIKKLLNQLSNSDESESHEVFTVIRQTGTHFFAGTHYSSTIPMNEQPSDTYFKLRQINSNLLQSLQMIVIYLFRFAYGLGMRSGQFISLSNQPVIENYLADVSEKSLNYTTSALEAIKTSLIIVLIILIVTVAAGVFLSIPLYSIIQKKKQQLIGLLSTFSVSIIQNEINTIHTVFEKVNHKNRNHLQENHNHRPHINHAKSVHETIKKSDEQGHIPSTTRIALNQQKQKQQTPFINQKRSNLSATSQLPKCSLNVILFALIAFCLTLPYPIASSVVSTNFINESRQALQLLDSLYEMERILIKITGLNYFCMYLRIQQSTPPYKYEDYRETIQELIAHSKSAKQELEVQLWKLKQINMYDKEMYEKFLFEMFESDICPLMNDYSDRFVTGFQFSQAECRTIYSNLLSRGLTISSTFYLSFFPDLYAIYETEDHDTFMNKFNAYQEHLDIENFYLLERYLIILYKTASQFLIEENSNHLQSLDLNLYYLLFYQFAIIAFIYYFGWKLFYGVLDSQLHNSKQALSVMKVSVLTANPYVHNYLINNLD